MVGLTRAADRAVGAERGRRASIREVSLLGPAVASPSIGPGDALAWAGRDYRVAAVEAGDYLHVRPADSAAF